MRQWVTAAVFHTIAVLLAPGFAFAQKPDAPAKPALTPPAKAGDAGGRLDEDWSVLNLSATHLTIAKPVVLETVERDGFVREMVALSWRPNDPVYVYVIRPKREMTNTVKPPVILYLYSYPQGTKRFTDDAYCRRLVASGCAAVGFESALTGERFAMRPMKQWFVSELRESLASTTHDVQLIINYLATRGDLDMARVGMFGQGSGGAIAVLAASVDARIKAVDLFVPWGDYPTWLQKTALISENERAQFNTPAFLESVAGLDSVAHLPALKGRPVRVTLLKDEPSVPDVSQSRLGDIATAMGATVQRFERNSAFLSAVNGGRLFAWLTKTMNALPPGEGKTGAKTPSVPAPP
ncbi:MAG: hypothetical protein H7Y38_08815 [Armatimonadetes bacterium]|nr:hypothetical protein [Armatimonadota bacterium]